MALKCSSRLVFTGLAASLPPLPTLGASLPSLPSRSRRWCCFSSSSSSTTSARALPSNIEPPDVLQLAEKARITLTPEEVEDFQPKLEQLGVWFSQLQELDLENVSPALRVDVGCEKKLRADVPVVFQDRDAMFAAVPEAEGPYVKVPKILTENME